MATPSAIDPAASAVRAQRAATADERARQTRRAIFDALDRLDVSGGTPTAAALIRESGVAKATFYTHFDGLGDALAEFVCLELRAIGVQERAERLRPGADPHLSVRRGIERIIDHAAAHRSVYALVLAGSVQPEHRARILSTLSEQNLTTGRLADSDLTVGELQAASTFLAAGAIELLGLWVQGRLALGRDQLADTILRLLPGWLSGDAPPNAPHVPPISHAADPNVVAPTERNSP